MIGVVLRFLLLGLVMYLTFVPARAGPLMSLSGDYYDFGFPCVSLNVKHGHLGQYNNFKIEWHFYPRPLGILVNLTC